MDPPNDGEHARGYPTPAWRTEWRGARCDTTLTRPRTAGCRSRAMSCVRRCLISTLNDRPSAVVAWALSDRPAAPRPPWLTRSLRALRAGTQPAFRQRVFVWVVSGIVSNSCRLIPLPSLAR